MSAKDLEQAYQHLDFMLPLRVGETWELYVDREHNPINELKIGLRLGAPTVKFLYAGHLGCGKSTELNRLLRDLLQNRRNSQS